MLVPLKTRKSITNSLDIDRSSFSVGFVSIELAVREVRSRSLPSIVVVAVNMQDLLALNTEHSAFDISYKFISKSLLFRTQRAHIPSTLMWRLALEL